MSREMGDFKVCNSNEPCVFRDKQKKICYALNDTSKCANCHFRKTKEEFLDGIRKYPSENPDFLRYVKILCERCE